MIPLANRMICGMRMLLLLVALTLSGTVLHAGISGRSASLEESTSLDRIDFGNTASEQAHAFMPDTAEANIAPAGTGQYGQTYREPVGSGNDSPTGSQVLIFSMACDPNLQNYLTIKLWGSDSNSQMYLYGASGYPPIDVSGGPPAYPGRFFYYTNPLPLAWTQGKTSVSITLLFVNYYDGYSGTGINYLPVGKVTRPVYSAFTHTQPAFQPSGGDPVGVAPTRLGQMTPTALSASQVTGILEANRHTIFDAGGYYDTLLSRQILPGTAGAPPETVGLDLSTTVSSFGGTSKSPDQWRDQAGGVSKGPGYAAFPDELVSSLTSLYLLPPFQDANGGTIAGLDHYHDASLMQRIVYALDGSSYLQAVDGRLSTGAGTDSNGMFFGGAWNGLTSTPRAAGHAYAGLTSRGLPWSLSLEGVDTQTLGWAIISLMNDPAGAPAFQNYLTQSYDADLNGGSMLRAYAYERMLFNQVTYLHNVAGGTISQNQFEILGMYANFIALEKLQQLFPNSAYTYTAATALNDLKEATGLIPTTLSNPNNTGYPNFALSAGGFGEAHGTLSGGYDGRYGQILPWLTPRLAQLSAVDPSLQSDANTVEQIRTAARATIDGYDQFISPLDNLTLDQAGNITADAFTLAQEDYVTYRNVYDPNANGNTFDVNTQYIASDPNGSIRDAYALRSVYLQALYGVGTTTSAGAGNGGLPSLNYLRDLASYESSLRSLINVNPSRLHALPGEPNRRDFAWADTQTGTAAFINQGTRFYVNSNWDSYEFNQVNDLGTPSYLARIHETTKYVDRAAMVFMPHDSTTQQPDGNLSGSIAEQQIVRYGEYLIVFNKNDATYTAVLPGGSGQAIDLLTKRAYPFGSSVHVPAGHSSIFWLVPTTTSKADFSLQATPGSASTIPPASANFNVAISIPLGSDMTVALQATGLPSGATATFSSESLCTNGSSRLTISTSTSVPPGTYVIDVVGTSGSLQHTVPLTLIVNAPPVPPPSPWTDSDVGSPSVAGSASYLNGVFTVKGSGADIYGTSDQFNFVSQPIDGDVTLTARVATQQDTNVSAKAGIMMRQSTAANAAYVVLAVTPTSGLKFEYRTSSGASAGNEATVNGVAAPDYLRLVRSGNSFTAFDSSDGVNWTNIGSINVTFSGMALAGLEVSSLNNNEVNISTFDHVSITVP